MWLRIAHRKHHWLSGLGRPELGGKGMGESGRRVICKLTIAGLVEGTKELTVQIYCIFDRLIYHKEATNSEMADRLMWP